MKTVFNNLSIFAVMAATVSAFAFNGLDPEPDPDLKLFANTPTGWQEVTSDYRCLGASENTCVAQFENDDTSTEPIYEEEGTFQKIGSE